MYVVHTVLAYAVVLCLCFVDACENAWRTQGIVDGRLTPESKNCSVISSGALFSAVAFNARLIDGVRNCCVTINGALLSAVAFKASLIDAVRNCRVYQ